VNTSCCLLQPLEVELSVKRAGVHNKLIPLPLLDSRAQKPLPSLLFSTP
jgi:hypothetical protein